MRTNFEKYLLEITQSSNCVELNVIQSLWSGYGKISRYRLEDSKLGAKTVVIKAISLGKTDSAHPRGWNTNLSHQRKLKSYEIETCWYKNWAHKTTAQCTIPKFIGEFSENESQWIVLEDLNENFPIRKQAVDLNEIKTCLKWLAHFHGRFIGEKPVGLWKVGTYWHLATRPEEFEKIQDNELKAKAHRIDALLNQCKFQTILHGDAKLANFCFSADSRRVAAVDFQYTGGGCG
ncbi:MAG: choline kinase, partial [Flavobacteriales bacterium]|nr:choline kinase [Flavobacteriales bacterium]